VTGNGRNHLKNWPEDERPRERLLKNGAESLTDAHLLAIILRTGAGGKTAIDVGRELLETFGGLAGVAQAGVSELCSVPGIGEAKAAGIKSGHRAGAAAPETLHGGGLVLREQGRCDYYQPRLRDARKEEFRCVLLDTKNRLIREAMVSTGSLTASLVHPGKRSRPRCGSRLRR